MTWQQWIKRRGIGDVAIILGVHYETVRAWVNDGLMPKDVNKKRLVLLSGGEIKVEDFFKS